MQGINLLLGWTDDMQGDFFWESSRGPGELLKKDNISVVTFGLSNADIRIDSLQDTFIDLETELKKRNFKPDIALIISMGYGFLMEGFETAPFPIIVLPLEWFVTTQNLQGILSRVDHLAGVIETSNLYLKRITGKEAFTLSLPFTWDNLETFHPIAEAQKAYDVVYVGNCDSLFNSERIKFLERLALLPERYKVLIADNRDATSGNSMFEGTNLLNNQAKICVNFSHPLVKGVNSRIVHTLLSGNFVLTEHLVDEKDFLQEGVHCAFYGEDDLEDKIAYYLEQEGERNSIAKQGSSLAASGIFTFTQSLLKLLHKLCEHGLNRLKTNRPFLQWPHSKRLNSLGVQAFHSLVTTQERGVTKGFKYFQEARKLDSTDGEIANNLGVAYAVSSLYRKDITPETLREYEEQALSCWHFSKSKPPGDAISLFNEACYYKRTNNWNEYSRTYNALNELFNIPSSSLSKVFPHLGLLLVSFIDFQSYKKWQDLFLYQFVDGNPTDAFYQEAKRFILWHVNEWKGAFLLEQGRYGAAAEHLELACDQVKDSDRTLTDLAFSYIQSGKLKQARDTLEKTLEVNPLKIPCAHALCDVLLALNEYEAAKQVGKKYRMICERISIFNSAVNYFRNVELGESVANVPQG